MPRRKPFSNKQKKAQLQQKREKKKAKEGDAVTVGGRGDSTHSGSGSEEDHQATPPEVARLNLQPGGVAAATDTSGYDANRYRLHFQKESKEEVERRKHLAKTAPLTPLPETALEVGVADVYRPGTALDLPKRPPWSYSMSKEEVEGREKAMFEAYLDQVYTLHGKNLSHFEHNLETWRQLWRVLEISDVVLLITDVRHPALHFSPSFYSYVVDELKKQVILVLNKVDLVPAQVAVAWRHYFLLLFPRLSVICFTSYPDPEASSSSSSAGPSQSKVRLRFKRRRRGRLPSAVGPRELLRVVEKMYQGKLNLSGWQEKIDSNIPSDQSFVPSDVADSNSESSEEEEDSSPEAIMVDSSPLVKDQVLEGVLTIGMVGHPNVGKSSIINGLMGKKLVSTSRTPGHTKHFQTIFLSSSVRLCDCPGLVFPSLVDKQLQVLSGMYPIAQVREPYTTVGYLAERVPLIQLLRLQHPDKDIPAMASKLRGVSHSRQGRKKKTAEGGRTGGGGVDNDLALAGVRLDSSDEEDVFQRCTSLNTTAGEVWTAWDICDAWAERRGYYTSRAARLDTYRAANSLLRLAVDGRISLYFRPPEYSKNKEKWQAHPEVSEMVALQSVGLPRPADDECLSKDNGSKEESRETGNPLTNTGANKFAVLMEVGDSSD